MPTVPGPTAVASFALIKTCGYGTFAHLLNRVTTPKASPLKFALTKTATGMFANYYGELRDRRIRNVAIDGVATSYALDGLIWLAARQFDAIPGMTMPLC